MKNLCILLTTTAFMLAFNSCNKELQDSDLYTFEFKYDNQTEYTINMKIFGAKQLFAEYKLNPFSDSKLTSGQAFLDAVAIPIPFNYPREYNYYRQADSVYLQFSDDRFITYSKGDSIFHYQAYEKTRYGDTLVIYQYYFTVEDYNNAKAIQ